MGQFSQIDRYKKSRQVMPILGFWMIPLGLAVLAIDIPIVRRFTRKVTVAVGRWWKKLRS